MRPAPEAFVPRLSVVMPTRNQAAFLPASMASVLARRADVPWPIELVIADGGSTDGTLALLEAAAREHPGRVRWFSEADEGPADAVNKAVRGARGPLIGWLNSDDLYTDGAIPRALEYLTRHPDCVMVYGEAEHIDASGARLGAYPTLAPDAPRELWRDGCPICQPTAFFRRQTFLDLGGLDTSLETAFDFDFWLRLFAAHPGRVGHVASVQAQSRLHPGAITMRMREQVALEGIEVVHRHLGPAPIHWLATYADEALQACPFDVDATAMSARLVALAEGSRSRLVPGGTSALLAHLDAHVGWRIAATDIVADIHSDGWAPPLLSLRIAQRPSRPYRRLRLRGRHASPSGGPLQLTMSETPGRAFWQRTIPRRGSFDVTIELPRFEARASLQIASSPAFVPRDTSPGSTDARRLGFLVESIELA
jgi:hypothetical protein